MPGGGLYGYGTRGGRSHSGQFQLDEPGRGPGEHRGDGGNAAERERKYGLCHRPAGDGEGSGGNPLSGVAVTFTAPASGVQRDVQRIVECDRAYQYQRRGDGADSDGQRQTGSYTVTAGVTGVSPSAGFALTNTTVQLSSANFVQQAAGSNVGNNQNTLTVTLGRPPSSSNVLLLVFGQVDASQTITSITGATWTRIAQNYAGNIGDSEIWVGTNPSSSAITITGTNYFGRFQPGYAVVAEFSGIATTLDGSALNTTGGIWPVTTGSLSTSNAADLLITTTLGLQRRRDSRDCRKSMDASNCAGRNLLACSRISIRQRNGFVFGHLERQRQPAGLQHRSGFEGSRQFGEHKRDSGYSPDRECERRTPLHCKRR